MTTPPPGLRYSRNHEYLKRSDDPDVFFVGVTDFYQSSLGEVIAVLMPYPGTVVNAFDSVATLESALATAQAVAPVDGEVVEVNQNLGANPGLVNSDPYSAGWLFKLRPSDPASVNSLSEQELFER